MKENRALALKPLRYVHVLAPAALYFLFHLPSCFFPKEKSLTITRLDVELALETGLPTLFRGDAVVPGIAIIENACTIKKQLLSTASRLSHIMLSIVSFASLLNCREREGRMKLDPLTYTENLVSLLYQLIEIAPLGQTRSILGLHDNVAHLAMLAFMTTLLPRYGRDDFNYLLSDRLDNALQELRVTSVDTQDSRPSLILWTLFIGGISVLRCKDNRSLILEICERQHLYDWPAVRDQLCRFPWIYTLHDDPGRCMWEDAQRRSADIS